MGKPEPRHWSHGSYHPAVRSGLLHLAEALSFRHDLEVANSTTRAVIATLRSGEKCTVEPELISKGTVCPLLSPLPHVELSRVGECLPRETLGCWRAPLSQPSFSPTVLRGLIEVRSPHLEELLTALFSATPDTSCPSPASGPIVVVSSLLLQEKDELPGPSKQDVEGAR